MYRVSFGFQALIAILFITGCSQQIGPSQSLVQKSLQKRIPAYLQVESMQVEQRENLGSDTEPKIQARFKASIKITEDLYRTTTSDDFLSNPRVIDSQIIEKTADKGKKVDLYGLSISERHADTWKTKFKIEVDPSTKMGRPRHEYSQKAIIKGSEEERENIQRLKKEAKEFGKRTVSSLFKQPHRGYIEEEEWRRHPFAIKFSSYDKSSSDFEGTISFGQTVERIQGKISDTKISFTTTASVKGKNRMDWGLGTKYLFDMNRQFPEAKLLTGTWENTSKSNGLVSIQLK